jgi:hypothetical protein
MTTTKRSRTSQRCFIRLVHDREASISIGQSTVRRQPAGTMKAAQGYLREVELLSFVTQSKAGFLRHLDAATIELRERLPSKSWGHARKFLNIFLRGALYNRFLCKHFGMRTLEPMLEVPLDNVVKKALRRHEGGRSLPTWQAISSLNEHVSAKYQAFALLVAREKSCARVHLDLWYFRRDESASCCSESGHGGAGA